MHKGVIILLKAETKEEAIEKVGLFLEDYENDVWDWYAIGGRWTQNLAPGYDDFLKETEKKFDLKYESDVERHREEIQKTWVDKGLTGENPYCNHYSLNKYGNTYDVSPLSICVNKVKDWLQKPEDVLKELAKAEKRWLDDPIAEGREPNYDMYGYCLKKASHILQQEFSFETNVFNINAEYGKNFSVPEDTTGWMAVMLDMHN